jgi:hypothetical protein
MLSPKLGCVSIWLRGLLAASVIAAVPIVSNAEAGSFAQCYGDAVEIVLHQSPTGTSTISVSVPSENVAIVDLLDGRKLYDDSPCHSEPLVARRLTGGLLNTSLGGRVAEEFAENDLSPRFFHLFPKFPDSVDLNEARRLAAVEADGIDQPDGLRVVHDRENPGQMNLVRLPLSYRTGSPPISNWVQS